ncbi:hypothetical protein [Puerhibacterium puerhi]|uniref:hypothetical protein n=1 Tax=Puerhibacterium puerhi TaxID=2692623 RepID=UPI00135815EC|nr:hypothetical protein [Puerhibacterium puerhi]
MPRPAPDDASVRARLVRQLTRGGDARLEIVSGDTVRIDAFPGLVDAPVRWELSDAELEAYVAALDVDDLDALWPRRPREWQAFALLSVHLEEVLATAEGPLDVVRLVDGALSAG